MGYGMPLEVKGGDQYKFGATVNMVSGIVKTTIVPGDENGTTLTWTLGTVSSTKTGQQENLETVVNLPPRTHRITIRFTGG
ncbi:hypothetical protein GPJ56_005647 [Histomonas meleagridis]|uniref:uncharacterized protein n=1 Tax=Histomonas meleagridis TaxID=135588 RepID=UPI003559ACA7|nr:hypothetical protein GPJ56_005647 [Histomonas meleagridis]KAH0803418.1 hypothetical protein GO595_003762 [Histomonas meleagridis]